jgi:two-component system response regulator HydG
MNETAQTRPSRVLVVDDEPTLLKALEALLRKKGYDVTGLESPIAATQRLAQEDFDVALLDVKMPQLSGLELLNAVKHRRPEIEVIMMTGHATVETALAAVKAGAYDYLTKPFEDVELVARAIAKAAERKALFDRNRELELQLRERSGAPEEGLVGASGGIREVTRMIDAVAYSSTTVLVTGESGTGKELVARALHARSPRRAHPFVALNCGALTETLLESELFGHVKGAFTGAQRDQKGLFDAADGGTIFLDEIGDIPPPTQVRLLRVLQEGEIKRVGSADSVRVDVRVIAATHRDLPKLVKTGRFREDLFYRLNVINVPLPPLRDRVEDIPLLAHHFLRRYAERLQKKVRSVSPEALDLLSGYRWPGNVRELANIVERLAILHAGAEVLPEHVQAVVPVNGGTAPVAKGPLPDAAALEHPLSDMLDEYERTLITRALSVAGGNVAEAARRLKTDRPNLYRRMRRLNIGWGGG